MPQYFFDIRDGANLFTDDEGLWFPNLQTAKREAAEAAASILLDAQRAGRSPSRITIEVRDESQRRIMAASVLVQIESGQEL